jgi:hypothetical protein
MPCAPWFLGMKDCRAKKVDYFLQLHYAASRPNQHLKRIRPMVIRAFALLVLTFIPYLSLAAGPLEDCRNLLYSKRSIYSYFSSSTPSSDETREEATQIFQTYFQNNNNEGTSDVDALADLVKQEYSLLKYEKLGEILPQLNTNVNECLVILEEYLTLREKEVVQENDLDEKHIKKKSSSFDQYIAEIKNVLPALEENSEEYDDLLGQIHSYAKMLMNMGHAESASKLYDTVYDARYKSFEQLLRALRNEKYQPSNSTQNWLQIAYEKMKSLREAKGEKERSRVETKMLSFKMHQWQ